MLRQRQFTCEAALLLAHCQPAYDTHWSEYASSLAIKSHKFLQVQIQIYSTQKRTFPAQILMLSRVAYERRLTVRLQVSDMTTRRYEAVAALYNLILTITVYPKHE